MDDYRILLGAAPTSEEQVRALAESLRRRRSFGELGALTGDRVLQPFGQGLSAQADKYAAQTQATRQKDIDNAQTKAYQDAQLQHMEDVLKETIRANNLDYSAQMAGIKQRNAAAMLDFLTGSNTDFRKMTDSTRNKLLQHADTLGTLKLQLDSFTPEYTQILGPGAQSRLPNVAARLGLGTKGTKEAQEWWAGWSRFYTLPVRNLLFGATLTPNEQRAWDQADINPGMDPAQIRTRIDAVMSEAKRSAKRRGQVMSTEGFDPQIIKDAYQDTIPELDLAFKATTSGGGRGGRSHSASSEEAQYPLDEIDAQIAEITRQLQGSQ